jgi:alkylated DNA repair protein (DNA oxidative demethylase)
MTTPEGFSYIPGFLDHAEHDALLRNIQELAFVHDQYRGKQLKRRYAQYGYAYISAGKKVVPAAPFPDWLTALAQKAIPHCPARTAFNQCIITHYPPGAGIGWHTDAPQFDECIIGISLAGTARLQFQSNKNAATTHELTITPGALYIMTGTARWHHQHQIMPVKTDRYSLTLRHVTEAKEH